MWFVPVRIVSMFDELTCYTFQITCVINTGFLRLNRSFDTFLYMFFIKKLFFTHLIFDLTVTTHIIISFCLTFKIQFIDFHIFI